MKDRPKLGRGLKDVSGFFLSQAPKIIEEAPAARAPSAMARSMCVIAPASMLIQSSLVSNLALESARRRHAVMIQDRLAPTGEGVADLMRAILLPGETEEGISRVRLYGLPEILIREREGPQNGGAVPSPASDCMAHDDSTAGLILVNPAPGLDSFLDEDAWGDYVLLSATDENSLLQCYAYMKVIHARSATGRIHVVFDLTGTPGSGDTVFQKLAGFVRDSLGFSIDFSGDLVRDEHFQAAIAEKKPLVLANQGSPAQDTLVRICSSLLQEKADPERGSQG